MQSHGNPYWSPRCDAAHSCPVGCPDSGTSTEGGLMASERTETTLALEKRTIDHIPVDERHGRGRDLFTIWFGSNIMLLTVATGVVATAIYGLPIWAAVLALVVGNV